jgi:acyl carrier protein
MMPAQPPSTVSIIIETIEAVLKNDGQVPPTLTPSTRVLAESGLHSISLAEVVVRLQDRLHKDPFKSGFKNFTTIQELADLYDR